MTSNELLQRPAILSHTLPADHGDLVAAVQLCAAELAGPAHSIAVLDVLVLDEVPDQAHTVAVIAEEYDESDHMLLFQSYEVDTETLVAYEHS